MDTKVITLHNALYRLMDSHAMNHAHVWVREDRIDVMLKWEVGCRCLGLVEYDSTMPRHRDSIVETVMFAASCLKSGEYLIGVYGTRHESDVLAGEIK